MFVTACTQAANGRPYGAPSDIVRRGGQTLSVSPSGCQLPQRGSHASPYGGGGTAKP